FECRSLSRFFFLLRSRPEDHGCPTPPCGQRDCRAWHDSDRKDPLPSARRRDECRADRWQWADPRRRRTPACPRTARASARRVFPLSSAEVTLFQVRRASDRSAAGGSVCPSRLRPPLPARGGLRSFSVRSGGVGARASESARYNLGIGSFHFRQLARDQSSHLGQVRAALAIQIVQLFLHAANVGFGCLDDALALGPCFAENELRFTLRL